MGKRAKLRAGEIVLFSHGEYSSYSVAGVFLVAKDFNFYEQREGFESDQRAQDKYIYGGDFPSWLAKNGYVMEIDAIEWHYDS